MHRLYMWLRARPILASLSALLALAPVMFVILPSPRVTKRNFERITVGMSQADLYDLLGKPVYDDRELGLVQGPESYTTNRLQSEEELRRRGFKDCRRQQWDSSELSIIVILDSEQRVVCRYMGGARRGYWLDSVRSWFSRLF
jgi:hypothetical protein